MTTVGNDTHKARTSSTVGMSSTLRALDHDVLAAERPKLASLVNWGSQAQVPLHRWYRYREGFSPLLLDALDAGRQVLDPFSGCGSIMVGAAQQGRSAVGIDVNPLATFVSRVKLSPLSPEQLLAVTSFLESFEGTVRDGRSWPRPELRISEKVFEPDVLDTLMKLRARIEEWSDDCTVRDFLLLAWIAILQDVGSYFKEGNGIKYRNKKRLKDGYVERADGEWQLVRFGPDQPRFVIQTFRSKLAQMIGDTAAWAEGCWEAQQVVEGSCLLAADALEADAFDTVLFSPPYANRFDYFESMKVELWFGGFVRSYEDMVALRRRSLRSHLGAALDTESSKFPEVESLIEQMNPDSYAIRMRVPALVRGYFDDMENILKSCLRVLKPGGKCNVVVGNSAYGGVIIPSDSLIAHIGLAVGFNRAEVVPVRHLTVAPQQRDALRDHESYMRESVVILS